MTATQIARHMVRAQSSLQLLSAAERHLRNECRFTQGDAVGAAVYRSMEHQRLQQAAQGLRRLAPANDPSMEVVPA